MNIIFFGLGSIGRKHASIINRFFPSFKIYSFSKNTNHNISYIIDLHSWNEINQVNPEIAFICNPTYLHIDTAIKCALNNMHLFIEKPISVNMNGIDLLLDIILKRKLSAYIAYPFRFHSEINNVKQQIENKEIDPKLFCCFTNLLNWGKQSYSFDRKLGGGVLYELSHELYLAEYLLGITKELLLHENLIRHNIYDINYSAFLFGKYEFHQCSLMLNLFAEYESRAIGYIQDDFNMFYSYQSNEKMYINQIKHFFENYQNPNNLQNDIFSCLPLFKKIIKLEELSWKES